MIPVSIRILITFYFLVLIPGLKLVPHISIRITWPKSLQSFYFALFLTLFKVSKVSESLETSHISNVYIEKHVIRFRLFSQSVSLSFIVFCRRKIYIITSISLFSQQRKNNEFTADKRMCNCSPQLSSYSPYFYWFIRFVN